MAQKEYKLRLIYSLAIIGDLTSCMLIILSVLYGTNRGLSTIEVGLIGGAYGFAYIMMPAILGRISDKISRKVSLIIATLGQMIITLSFLLIITQFSAFIFYGLFLGLFSYGIIYSFFWPSIEAYISENTKYSSKEHEKGIANFCISWSIGYALGPLFGGFFYDFNMILAFILAFILYALFFFLILFKLPYIKPKNKANTDSNAEQFRKFNPLNHQVIQYSHSNQVLFLFLTGVMIYATITAVILSYFTNYAALPKGLNWAGALIGQVIFFFGLGRTFYFFIARYHKNSFAAITQSFLIIGLCLIALPFFYPPFLIAILFFITGFFVGRTYLISLELILKYEPEKKGAKAGLFESTIGVGSSFSPLFAGIIATFSLKMPFLLFGFIVFTFILIHIIFKKNIPFEENKKNS